MKAQTINPTVDFDLSGLIRPNFKRMHFYKSARGEFSGAADVLLDANENPFDNGHNRYPDPVHTELRQAIAESYGVGVDNVFVGNGSSEALDLLMRLVCRPGQDRIVQLPPTFGIYQVDADLNDLAVLDIPLDRDMQPDVAQVLAKADPDRDRILFLCTPNNPTGNDYEPARVMALVEAFPGIVVIDQAYVEFSGQPSYRKLFETHPNVMTIETMSKAYGLAGSRVGVAFASAELIAWLNGIKPPYNVSIESGQLALEAVRQRHTRVARDIAAMKAGMKTLLAAFAKTDYFEHVYPTNANFVLVKLEEANALYDYLVAQGIVVRNQTSKFGYGHLRINVGTAAENARLLGALEEWRVRENVLPSAP